MMTLLQENMGAGYMEAIPVAEGIQPIPVPALPPYNGFGSFEDSEQSCKNLVSVCKQRLVVLHLHLLLTQLLVSSHFSPFAAPTTPPLQPPPTCSP